MSDNKKENDTYNDIYGELNSDEEFLSYCQKINEEYKFTREDLMAFVCDVINDCGFYEFLQRASREGHVEFDRTKDLDGDLMGIFAIKLTAMNIANLKTNKKGYSFINKKTHEQR